jgi:hypothetical protein
MRISFVLRNCMLNIKNMATVRMFECISDNSQIKGMRTGGNYRQKPINILRNSYLYFQLMLASLNRWRRYLKW